MHTGQEPEPELQHELLLLPEIRPKPESEPHSEQELQQEIQTEREGD